MPNHSSFDAFETRHQISGSTDFLDKSLIKVLSPSGQKDLINPEFKKRNGSCISS